MRLMQQTVTADRDQRGMPALWEVTKQADTTVPASEISPPPSARGLLGTVGDLAGVAPALTDAVWRAVRRRDVWSGGLPQLDGPMTLAAPHAPLNVPIGGARCFTGRTL